MNNFKIKKSSTSYDSLIEIIKDLAYVGMFLSEITNDKTFKTNFYIAKESLLDFKKGITQLKFPYETEKGILDLIEYLERKINEKSQHSNNHT